MADNNRSISSGMSLPQWMKTRMNDSSEVSLADIIRLNFDQTAFSPPENDDSFLYIRYNRTPSTNIANNTSDTHGQSTPRIEVVTKAASPTVLPKNNTTTDFSKHTDSCKQYISKSTNALSEAVKPIAGKLKSAGTDDGFKGEAAQCGSSVIRVAHQMVSGKFSLRDSTISSNATIHEEEYATEPPGFNKSFRRGSKSLPSSPLTSPNSSPKSKRRQMNRYFSDSEKMQNSWILSGLLRKNELSRSVSVINEEDIAHDTLTKSISQISIEEVPEVAKVPSKKNLKAKPSELREMNFWSPTSM